MKRGVAEAVGSGVLAGAATALAWALDMVSGYWLIAVFVVAFFVVLAIIKFSPGGGSGGDYDGGYGCGSGCGGGSSCGSGGGGD